MKQTHFLIIAKDLKNSDKPIILCCTNDIDLAQDLQKLHANAFKNVKIFPITYYHIYKDYAKLTEIR